MDLVLSSTAWGLKLGYPIRRCNQRITPAFLPFEVKVRETGEPLRMGRQARQPLSAPLCDRTSVCHRLHQILRDSQAVTD